MIHKSFDAKYLTYLARFIRKRDKEAFAELYNYTHKKIDQYALQFLKDPHLAQDAVQEIYILIYKNIDSLKEDSLFLSWMNQITYHARIGIFWNTTVKHWIRFLIRSARRFFFGTTMISSLKRLRTS